MSFKRCGIGLFGLLAVSACDTISPVTESADPYFGEATKYNAAVQVIDPDPVYTEADAKPGASGEKGTAAVKRYRTDQVKQVEQIGTQSAGSGPR